MLFNLYKKELNKFKKGTILFLGLVLIINIFFFYKTYNGWAIESGFLINMFLLPLTFFIPLILSESKLISQEFKDNTIYLSMMLPVSSEKIFLSKFLAVITQYIVSSLSIVIITSIQFMIFMNRTSSIKVQEVQQLFDIRVFSMATSLYVFSIVGLLYLVSAIFLSSIIGKTFKKYSKLISFASVLAILYVGGKIIGFMMDGLDKIGLTFNNIVINYNMEKFMGALNDVGSGLFVTSAIILFVTAIIYFATCKIYDKKIEI
ncbi:hypothetical protein [Tepidibacter sp. Z1-5]|uniref:hypothetical protein n=1 Tax=Tepidibacter sp. Z1-5 TaxID=3134138 RepID=UPI0030C03B4B